MKSKIKRIAYSLSAAALALPVLASAAFQAPTGTGLQSASISDILQNIMQWLLWVVGIVGVIGFALAGIMYLIAAGDQTMIDRAKKAMIYSIIGVVVALAGLVVLNFFQGLLGAQSKF